MKDYTGSLARHVSNLRLGDVPDEIVQEMKLHILDALGCGIFGSTLPWSKKILEVWRQPGGPPEATVWGEGCKLPVASAALINGSFNHSFELDDYEGRVIWAHPSGPCVAAALALAERSGGTGGRFLEAIIGGIDVWLRVCVAINAKEFIARGLHTSAFGGIGAAAVAGKMIGFDESQIESAFGIAGTENSASQIVKYSGSHLKRLYAGRVARIGVEAALLTEKGLVGPSQILEAPYGGMFVKYWGLGNEDKYDFELLTKDLGTDYNYLLSLCIKPYPSHGHTHINIDLALDLARQHKLASDEIDEITITTRTRNVKWLAHYEPKDLMLAQQSIPFTVAAAFVDGEFTIDQVQETRLQDKKIIELARKIRLVADPTFDALLNENIERAQMRVKVKNGQEYVKTTDNPRGSPERPLTKEEIIAKYRKLAQTKILPPTAEAICDMVMNLETLRDVSQIGKLCGGP